MSDNEFATHPVNIGIGAFLLSWTAFISWPLFTVSWLKLRQHHKRRYFQQRGVPLIIFQTAIMTIFNCLLSPLEILTDDLRLFAITPILAKLIENMLDGTLFLALFVVICIRVWLLNYEHKLQLEMANAAWKEQLHAFSVNSSFFTKHKNTLGSLSWMSKLVGTVYVSLIGLMILFDFVLFEEEESGVPHMIGQVMMTITYVLPIVLLIAMWLKFPKFNDNLFIRQELAASFVFTIAVMVLGAVLFGVSMAVAAAYNLSQFALILTVDGLCYISILRVVRLNNPSHSNLAAQLAENNAEDLDDSNKAFGMEDVISCKVGYVEFMKFLVHEFASENLCFVTEYCQFRESLHLTDEQKESFDVFPIHPAYSKKKSEFQTRTLDCHEFITIVTKLYTKYIASGTATYEINVSYAARMRLAVLLDAKYKQYVAQNQGDVSKLELPKDDLAELMEMIIPLLEEILRQITGLLHSLFRRFKQKDGWKELCANLMEEHKQHSKQSKGHHEEELTVSRTKSFNVLLRAGSLSSVLRRTDDVNQTASTLRREPKSPSASSPDPEQDGQRTYDVLGFAGANSASQPEHYLGSSAKTEVVAEMSLSSIPSVSSHNQALD